MTNIKIPTEQIVMDGVLLDEFAESLAVAGQLATVATEPAVLTQNTLNGITIAESGTVSAENTAIQVEGIATIIDNKGTIDGGFNGINIANGDVASALINNTGIITSGSRAVNIGGIGGALYNEGLITGSADPRNGTVYGDVTAQNIFITNGYDGVIDVGVGLNGDAISLELGAEVNGSVINEGIVQGRGLPDGAPNNQANQAAAVRLYWVGASGAETSVFNGNIENYGTLAAENGATVLIENRTQLRGEIINTGTIDGGATPDGLLAIDASLAEGELKLNNRGLINGDVLLTHGNDRYNGRYGTVNGIVDGGQGHDTLIGSNNEDYLVGGAGNDVLRGNGNDDYLVGGVGSDILVGGRGNDVFSFLGDIFQDGLADIDHIEDFQAEDSFDFSDYLQVGGQISFARGQNNLLINLSGEDFIIVGGNLNAAEQQLQTFIYTGV